MLEAVRVDDIYDGAGGVLKPLVGLHWVPGHDGRTRLSGGIGPKIHWCIVGGESGSKARPFDLAWARSILKQCKDAAVPCFMKQLGANPHQSSADAERFGSIVNLKDSHGGDIDEFPEDLRVREIPTVPS
jgi:hypothetical protein